MIMIKHVLLPPVLSVQVGWRSMELLWERSPVLLADWPDVTHESETTANEPGLSACGSVKEVPEYLINKVPIHLVNEVPKHLVHEVLKHLVSEALKNLVNEVPKHLVSEVLKHQVSLPVAANTHTPHACGHYIYIYTYIQVLACACCLSSKCSVIQTGDSLKRFPPAWVRGKSGSQRWLLFNTDTSLYREYRHEHFSC